MVELIISICVSYHFQYLNPSLIGCQKENQKFVEHIFRKETHDSYFVTEKTLVSIFVGNTSLILFWYISTKIWYEEYLIRMHR